MVNTPTFSTAQARLAAHADAIRTLGKRVVGDVIEIGRRLSEAKVIAGHGNWLPWLEREFGWTDKTAERFMSVHALNGKFDNLSNMTLPISGLYLLAAPSTPDEARDEIINRDKNGEQVSVAEIKNTIDTAKGCAQPAHKPPTTPQRAGHDRHKCWQCDKWGGLGEVERHEFEDYCDADVWLHPACVAAFRLFLTKREIVACDDIEPESTGEIERLRARVEQLQNQIAEKDRDIKSLQAEIAEKDRHIRELSAENRRLDSTVNFFVTEREIDAPDAPDDDGGIPVLS